MYDGFFQGHEINRVEYLLTAWNNFTQQSPGESDRVDTEGKSIDDISEMFKEWGYYMRQIIYVKIFAIFYKVFIAQKMLCVTFF